MEKNYARGIRNEEEVNEEEFQEELNQNNKDINHEGINGQEEEIEEEDDDRLTYTLITLDLGNLIHIFEDNNISFIDMLLLSKEDLIELQLEIFQRNRILNFSHLFTKYAKNYSIREISDFFTFNKQFIFNSSIYDKVLTNNMYTDDMDNSNFNMDNNNNNFEPLNQEENYMKENQNINIMTQPIPNNQSNINNNSSYLKLNNKLVSPNNKEPRNKTQNINGATKKNKNISTKMINDQNQDNFQSKLQDFIKKTKTPKSQNIPKGNNKNNNRNGRYEEYQKLLEKIGLLESNEINYDLYTRLNLIKNYINNKGDKITLQDIININNDVDSMIEVMNGNPNYKNIGLNNNISEINKRKNKIKMATKK